MDAAIQALVSRCPRPGGAGRQLAGDPHRPDPALQVDLDPVRQRRSRLTLRSPWRGKRAASTWVLPSAIRERMLAATPSGTWKVTCAAPASAAHSGLARRPRQADRRLAGAGLKPQGSHLQVPQVELAACGTGLQAKVQRHLRAEPRRASAAADRSSDQPRAESGSSSTAPLARSRWTTPPSNSPSTSVPAGPRPTRSSPAPNRMRTVADDPDERDE